MGPFFLTDLLGLDTVLHVAEHLNDSYGESFYVHKGLQGLVAEGKLGAKTGGEGFFKDGEQNIPGDAEPDAEELVAMFTCRALIEACLLVEEGVCSVRDIDLGMMAGAGLDPRKGLLPPFWKADVEGLDKVLETMEGLAGEARRPLRAAGDPEAPRRPGPLRPLDRAGLLPLPAGRRGRADRDGQARDPRRGRDRLARQPADELDLAAGGRGPGDGLEPAQGRRRGRRDGRSPPRSRSSSRPAPTSRPSRPSTRRAARS